MKALGWLDALGYICKGTFQIVARTNVLSAGHLVESSAIQWSMWVPSKLCGEAPQMLVRDVMESGTGLLRR